MLDWGRKLLINLEFGRIKRLFGVAYLGVFEPGVGLGRIFRHKPVVAEGHHRVTVFIAHDQAVGRVARGLVGLGKDHGDNLAIVPDFGALEHPDAGRSGAALAKGLDRVKLPFNRFPRQDVDHAGQRARFAFVDLQHGAERNCAGVEIGKGRVADRHVGRITRAAGYLQRSIDPAEGSTDSACDGWRVGIKVGAHDQFAPATGMSRTWISARTSVRWARSGL